MNLQTSFLMNQIYKKYNTIESFCQQTKIDKSVIHLIQQNGIMDIPFSEIVKICHFLQIDLSDLIHENYEKYN